METIRPKEEPSIPPWVKRMARSKYFWITLAIGIPFIVVWVKYGFGWAIGMLIALAVVFAFTFTNYRRRIRRHYLYYDDEEEDEEIIVERSKEGEKSPLRRVIDEEAKKLSKSRPLH